MKISYQLPLRPWPAGLAIVAGLSLVAPAQAQPADDTLAEQVSVELVLVDLVATSRGGEPVLDLGVGELRVFDDDAEVEISEFSPPEQVRSPASRGSVAEAAGVGGPLPPERAPVPNTLVIFLDDLHLRLAHRKKVLKQLASSVRRDLGAGGKVMVARYDGEVHVLSEPTSDTASVAAALQEEMRKDRTPMLATLARVEPVLQRIEEMHRDKVQGAGGGRNDPCFDMGALARTHAQQSLSVVHRSIFGLRLFVDALASVPGRKNLLYVSDGVPAVPGTEAYALAVELCDDSGRISQPSSAPQEFMLISSEKTTWDPRRAWAELAEFQTAEDWTVLAAYANANQISFYSLQASGLQGARLAMVDGAATSGNFEMLADANSKDALFLIADESGGRAIFNTNDLSEGVRLASADADHTYQLAYVPIRGADGRRHRIRVEVDRPGVQLRHRRSYVAKPPEAELAELVLASLVLDAESNPLGVRVLPQPPRKSEGGERLVTVRIELPLESLAMIPGATGASGSFSVAVGGRLASGRFIPVGQKEITVRASEVDRETQSFVYEVEVPLRGRQATVAVAVKDNVGGERSYLREEVELAGPTPAGSP